MTTTQGSSPTVLCHATGFCGAVLAPLARALHEGPTRCPDLRGHGTNQLEPGGDLSWSRWADDALAAVEQLTTPDRRQSRAVYGFGHSGGGAAMLLAEQRRPGTFRALYLFEPVVFPPAAMDGFVDQQPNPMSEVAARRRADFPSRDAAYENFAAKPPMDSFAPEALRAYVEHGFADQPDGTVTLRCRPENEARMYQMAPQSRAWDALATVQCPVVVARGRVGTGAPVQFTEPVVQALQDAELQVFDHLGHFGPMEAPGEIAAAFQALIDRTR
jgi:pimeloyl-ACP methyl ester carboxylesterase